MQKITDNIYGILTKFGYMNQYVIVNEATLTVVDMLLGESDVDNLEKQLGTQGWSLDDVNHMLITHAHPDHIGGLPEFQRRSNATTYAHRIDAQVIRGETDGALANPDELTGFSRLIYRQVSQQRSIEPARVDVNLSDGDQLNDILEGLQVIHLPGHSHGQVGFYVPQQKLLIGGDVMMYYFGSLRMPIRAVSPDWNEVKQSIRRVAAMYVDILCLGHGKPLINANPIIQRFTDTLAE
jgi:glyoxylase-like metal-dependent hydrolase (beta-lactamase superfamily II)